MTYLIITGDDSFDQDQSEDEELISATSDTFSQNRVSDIFSQGPTPPVTSTQSSGGGQPISTPVTGAPWSSGTQSGQQDLQTLMATITAGIASGFSEKIGDTVKEVVSGKRKKPDDDFEEHPEDLVLVDVPNHHIKDDGANVGDWVARSLKPWTGEQKELWKHKKRVSRPVLQDLKDSHLSRSYVNPRLIARLHDRGAELCLRQFFHKNANVTERKGKLKVDNEANCAAYTYDYVEPQTVWECVDAIYHYVTALRSVRQEDYSGLVILRALHDVRFFAGANKTDKAQAAMITKFVNYVFVRNAMRGRSLEPPLPYNDTLEVAKCVLFEAGHDGMASVIGVEPYTGNRGATQNQTTNNTRDPRRQGNNTVTRNPQQGGSGFSTKSFSDMSTTEKVARCCRNYNSARGCSFPNCRRPHICSKVLPNGQVCWKGTHTEITHQ